MKHERKRSKMLCFTDTNKVLNTLTMTAENSDGKREKIMVLIECSFWSTHPVCPRSAAWWSAPLPLLFFWFILAPFCKRNSQAGNDPLRKKNNNFITWWPFHEGTATTQHSRTPSTERVKPTPKTDWWSAVFRSSSSFTQFTLAPENFP